MLYAERVERALPSGWKIFKQYNPYGFGMILVRTTENSQFVRMPFGEQQYLELLIYLSVSEYPMASPKISQEEFIRKERRRSEIEQKQKDLLKKISPKEASHLDPTEPLPVTVQNAAILVEYNKLVDEMRANEKNFPRYYTETFGVVFHYPRLYQIAGVSEDLANRFLQMVEKTKAVFPKYEQGNR